MDYQDLSKFCVPKGFRKRSAFLVQLWWFVQSTLIKYSPQIAYPWRRFLYRLFGAKVGKKVIIRPSVKTVYPWNLEIGDHSWIGDDVVLYTLGKITIGRNTVVSQRSYLCTGSHDYKCIDFKIEAKSIVINDQVWLATDVFVAPGVHIDTGVVVGARSSVYSNLPKGKICLGNPASPVKSRL